MFDMPVKSRERLQRIAERMPAYMIAKHVNEDTVGSVNGLVYPGLHVPTACQRRVIYCVQN